MNDKAETVVQMDFAPVAQAVFDEWRFSASYRGRSAFNRRLIYAIGHAH